MLLSRTTLTDFYVGFTINSGKKKKLLAKKTTCRPKKSCLEKNGSEGDKSGRRKQLNNRNIQKEQYRIVEIYWWK